MRAWPVLILLGLIQALAGCERSDGKVHVTYWEKWTGAEGEAMQKVVDQFNRSQDRIVVEYLSVAGVDRKTLVATAGGDPPDVAGLSVYNIYSFADRNALTPLDVFIKAERSTPKQWMARYDPVYADMCEYGGKVWAQPSAPTTYALHWNKAMFRAAGLDPERPPRTLEELDDFAERLTRVDPKTGELLQLGFLPQEPGWIAWAFAQWFGGELWNDKDITLGSRRENLRAYQWVERYSTKYGLEKIRAFRSGFGTFASPQNPFFDGKLAIVFQGVWMNNYIRQFAPGLEYGVAPLPAAAPGLEGFSVADADVLVIPRGAKHAREAWEFIKFVGSNNPNATRREELRGTELLCFLQEKNSPLTEWSPFFTKHHPHPSIQLFRELGQSKHAVHLPKIGIWQEYARELSSVFDNVRLLEQPPQEALRVAQSRLGESWARHRESVARRRGHARASQAAGSLP